MYVCGALAWGGFVALRPLVRLSSPPAVYALAPLSVCVCVRMYVCLCVRGSVCDIALRMTLVEALLFLRLMLAFVH